MQTNAYGISKLDPDFYRSRYPDLRSLSPSELLDHYVKFGAAEARSANLDDFLVQLAASGAAIPSDFTAIEYRRLHKDVDAQCHTDWDAYIHYSQYGAAEGRRYTDIDIEFYRAIYLNGNKFPAREIATHISETGRKAGHYVSMDALLRGFSIRHSHWIEAFSAREFSLLNYNWLGGMMPREKAIFRFLHEGVDRIASIGFGKRFDPVFYRETNPRLVGMSDVALYWHWLRSDPGDVRPGSAIDWFGAKRIVLTVYPNGFAWRSYAARHLPTLSVTDVDTDARWTALSHLYDHLDTVAEPVPTVGPEAAAFLTNLGSHCAATGRAALALKLFEQAYALRPNGRLAIDLADCYYAIQAWRPALQMYVVAHEHYVTRSVSSVANAVVCHLAFHDFDGAFRQLFATRDEYGGNQIWRDRIAPTIEAYFQYESDRARACYSDGDRAEGDAIMLGAVRKVYDWWTSLLLLPVRSQGKDRRRVAMLAVTSLPQCKHYRVDQKRELLAEHDIEIDIFDFQDVDNFIKALPDAAAAIFYRVPAFPQVTRAIALATAQGMPTYYDIDDLIFDPDHYPDPYETFQGAISPATYDSLIFGTPLHQGAMQLCDYGMVSTPALGRYTEKFVKTGRVFVVRNGLDSRIDNVRQLPRPNASEQTIRLFYGSGTLAHNQDFNDVAVHAILPLMLAETRIELVIAGHLDLDPRFEIVQDRVFKIGIITPPSAYWSMLSSCDINLATLSATKMNDCKSEIKWLEAARLGIPSIVSATSTYCDIIQNGKTGILAPTLAEWADAIRLLVNDPALRHAIGRAACSHVTEAYAPSAISKSLAAALPDIKPNLRSRKRVLIVNVFYPPQSIGGATRVVADNVRDWRILGADIEFAVATTDYESKDEYAETIESWDGIPVFRVAAPYVQDLDWQPYDPRMKNWFHRVLERFDPDLVHFHCIQRLTGSVIDVCLEEAVPYMIGIHDGWWLSDYQFMFDEQCRVRTPGDEVRLGTKPGISLGRSIERKLILDPLLRGAKLLTTPSTAFARIYAEAGYPGTTVIANGIPEIALRPKTLSPGGRVRIGHIGDTSPHKGFDLIEAALRQNRFENIELVGVSHAQAEGREVCDVWGASPVLLRGKVPQDRVGDLYADLDVLAAPSACAESYGLVTREANAAGLWVIASDRGAIGEDVRPGIDGFIIDVSSPAGLVEVFRTINDNPAKFLRPAPRNDIPSARQQAALLLRTYEDLINA